MISSHNINLFAVPKNLIYSIRHKPLWSCCSIELTLMYLLGSYFYLFYSPLRCNRWALRKLNLIGNTLTDFSELLQG